MTATSVYMLEEGYVAPDEETESETSSIVESDSESENISSLENSIKGGAVIATDTAAITNAGIYIYISN